MHSGLFCSNSTYCDQREVLLKAGTIKYFQRCYQLLENLLSRGFPLILFSKQFQWPGRGAAGLLLPLCKGLLWKVWTWGIVWVPELPGTGWELKYTSRVKAFKVQGFQISGENKLSWVLDLILNPLMELRKLSLWFYLKLIVCSCACPSCETEDLWSSPKSSANWQSMHLRVCI